MALFEVILFQFLHEEGMLVKNLWEVKEQPGLMRKEQGASA